MSYYRTYLTKNNTIIKDSRVNTAKNPNTELFYGNGFSKFIFQLDLDVLKNKIDNGDLVLNETTKHFLNFTNTIFGDENFKGVLNSKNRLRATSFDIILFKINEFWDEGVGFDYEQRGEMIYNQQFTKTTPSNWFKRTSLNEWETTGIYSTEPEIITTIHFDNGHENIKCDVTEYVNQCLSGSTTHYGLGLAFSPQYELIKNSVEYSVAFFTKYTQTFYEPYLETVFFDTINDERLNFVLNKENKLYLYTFKNNLPYDLDYNPIVDILDYSNNVVDGLSDIPSEKIKKGVYEINLTISGETNVKYFLIDNWKNISIDGNTLSPIKQKFLVKPYHNLYQIGEYNHTFDRFIMQYYGIKMNEKIKRGDIRKITIDLKSIKEKDSVLFDEVYYRLYVKEGKTNVEVFDWTLLDKTNKNYFLLDTSFMIPKEYFIQIKTKHNNEIIQYDDEIKFEIISEK